jgi:signal transduction histidine kinase
MGGRIVVRSREGHGTRIRLVFIAPTAARAAAYHPPVFDPRLPLMPNQPFRSP